MSKVYKKVTAKTYFPHYSKKIRSNSHADISDNQSGERDKNKQTPCKNITTHPTTPCQTESNQVPFIHYALQVKLPFRNNRVCHGCYNSKTTTNVHNIMSQFHFPVLPTCSCSCPVKARQCDV